MSSRPSQAIRPNDDVLGYKLKYPIGSGGYGEVWAVDAPGGLTKAVKFIYGFHDEDRAQRELKALDRIKQLRHPFLISLERIDIVDGRLVIITELADKCLREHFVEFRDKNEQGVPRDKLLSYLKNVAEALDYISGDHSLQHLDIKPENLLLVGTHCKVADFGLVKNVHDVNQSMMDGLTPTYAAPEIFDGKPSRSSDQYSLAIVYQELLSGTRPFSGTTAAQLASQHIGSRPNLRGLPTTDQAVIARALAKDPEKRYPNCTSMVDDLMRRKVVAKTRRNSNLAHLDNVDTSNMTRAIDATRENHTEKLVANTFSSSHTIEAEIEKLPPLDVDEASAKVRPTVFIGIGQSAGKILARIKGQIASRVGSNNATPAIKFLYFDTDRRALYNSTTSVGNAGSLADSETFEMPLRSREDYRNNKKDFSWLSRRWLFNVPRSLQTEGLRPLGRLAMADHFDSIYQRISDVVSAASETESLAETAEALMLNPSDEPPQVFIVSSIAGGIGSGTAIDFTQTVRTILSEHGIQENHIYGVFTHSAIKDVNAQQLAIANTYSFLCEYNHFCLHGYHGDKTIDLPSFDSGPMFAALYLMNLGDNMSDDEYGESLNSIAQYLFLSTATTCNQFFVQCRAENEGDESGLMLRSMGLSSAAGGVGGIVNKTVHGLAEKLIDYWKQDCGLGKVEELRKTACEILEASGFETKQIEEKWNSIETKTWPDGIMQQADLLVESLITDLNSESTVATDCASRFLKEIQALSLEVTTVPQSSLMGVLENAAEPQSDIVMKQISEQCFQLVNQPSIRLAGASMVVANILIVLQDNRDAFEKFRTDLIRQNVDWNDQFQKHFTKGKFKNLTLDQIEKTAEQVARVRFKIARCNASMSLLKYLVRDVKKLLQHLNDLSQQLVLVNESFQEACGASLLDSMDTDFLSRDLIGGKIVKSIQDRFAEMVVTADEQFNQLDLRGYQGLFDLVNDRSAWLRELPAHIKSICQALIVNDLKKIDIDRLIAEGELTEEVLSDWIETKINAAKPPIINCGGSIRLMLGVPDESTTVTLSNTIGQQSTYEPTVCKGACGDFIYCFEVRDIPLDNFAIMMIDMRTDCAELVQRLHVRNDIEWTSLTQMA